MSSEQPANKGATFYTVAGTALVAVVTNLGYTVLAHETLDEQVEEHGWRITHGEKVRRDYSDGSVGTVHTPDVFRRTTTQPSRREYSKLEAHFVHDLGGAGGVLMTLIAGVAAYKGLMHKFGKDSNAR